MPWFPFRSSAHEHDPHDEEYSTPLPVPIEDEPLHFQDHPFCLDPSCGCHEDPTLIGEVNDAYQEGLLTRQEATDVIRGKFL